MSSSAFALRLATEPVVGVTLEQIAREGARRALQKAIEDEVAEYLDAHACHVDESNHRLVVRNGRKPPRTILSGVGPIEVIQPRVDDRWVDENGVRFRFTSKILPPYLRKTKAIEDLVPGLYLKGISTGEMPDALIHLGFDGSGLSPTSVVRMLQRWIRLLADRQLLADLSDRLARRQHPVSLTQMRDDLLGRTTLPANCTHRESPGPCRAQ
ncbi:MAG: transposase, partial [Tepidisphaeraceae bacterium]